MIEIYCQLFPPRKAGLLNTADEVAQIPVSAGLRERRTESLTINLVLELSQHCRNIQGHKSQGDEEH